MEKVTVLSVLPDGLGEHAGQQLRAAPELSVIECATRAAATDRARNDDIDCVVTAYELPESTGIDLLRDVREHAPATGCILYTDPERARSIPDLDGPLVTEYVDSEAPNAADRLTTLVSVTGRRDTQTAYPRPDTEDDRLDQIADMELESPALQRALDRIAELAVRQFDGDRAAVNVIRDATQEVLACSGTDWSTLPREESICTYTILSEDITVIGDVAEDSRFADNERLGEMNIRFYAGAPIRIQEGPVVGTLCIYATVPGELSDESAHTLQLLADEAAQWLELHRTQSGANTGAEHGGNE